MQDAPECHGAAAKLSTSRRRDRRTQGNAVHLIVVLVVAVLIYLILSRRGGGAGGPISARRGAAAATDRRLAFVSRGKLFVRAPGQTPEEVQSPYVQGVIDRLERSRERHSWKQGTTFGTHFARQDPMDRGQQLEIQATSAQFLDAGRMLYFLKDQSFGGLFEQNLDSGEEKRLLHKQNLSLEDLRLSPDGSRLLCAQRGGNGIANIAVMNIDGSDYRELTGGDTLDTAPAWYPGNPDLAVFQSSGLARNAQGFVIAAGPASVQMVDTAKGALQTVLEDTRFDYLQPRVGHDGCLYFIRRPYEAPQYGAGNAVLDALLFPFRLLRAVFHYLNFFSLMYTRKPLTTAAGPALQADLKEILLKGRRLDAEEALRKGALVNGVRSLVPASWQLVCRSPQGEEQVLAHHVASFDIADDGSLLFSNGNGVFALGSDPKPRVLLQDQLVAEVIVGPV